MRDRRFTLTLWVFVLCCSAAIPRGIANKNADIPKFDPPVQNYAVIDISGNKDSAVTMIGLNDDNQAAFDIPTEPYEDRFVGTVYKHHRVYIWKNGVLGAEQITLGYEDDFPDNPYKDSVLCQWPANFTKVLATGMLIGDRGESKKDESGSWNCYLMASYALNGSFGDLDLPFPYLNLGIPNGCFLTDVSEHGPKIGYAVEEFGWFGSEEGGAAFLEKDGNLTIFDDGLNGGAALLPDYCMVEPTSFGMVHVNKDGWVLGYTENGAAMWEGEQGMVTIGQGYVAGLNDQGQAIVDGTVDDSPSYGEGYLWENGNSVKLLDQLPFYAMWQYQNIQPLSLSNQVKPVPQSPGDITIHIMAKADGTDVGTYKKMLWIRGDNGRWNFANVALPEGTAIAEKDWKNATINSSGVVAVIGNGRHALLLVPVNINIWKEVFNGPPSGIWPDVGVIATNSDTLTFCLDGVSKNETPVASGQPIWKSRQLKNDGSYTSWKAMGSTCVGNNFDYTQSVSGIFQVEAVFFGDDDHAVRYVRKYDELKTNDGEMGPGKKGHLDSIGICGTLMQGAIRNEANKYLGSPTYNGLTTPIPPEFGFSGYPAIPISSSGDPDRCNIFVAHRCCAVGATVPAINGLRNSYPPNANQWAGIQSASLIPFNFTTAISNWPLLSAGTFPQPGYVIAHPKPGDSGHCGIVDYDGGGIAAGQSGTVNKKYQDFQDGTSLMRNYTP